MSNARDPNDIIGYDRSDSGSLTPIYKPQKGSIVTHAFIMCSDCGKPVYHCMGPRYTAVCLNCVENDNIILSSN